MFQDIIKQNDVISIWGPSGSGKSIAIKELYLKYKKKSYFLNNFKNLDKICNNKKIEMIFIDDILIYLSNKKKQDIISKMLKSKKKIIFTTSNPEELLFATYIYILNNCEIVIDGSLIEVLRNEKIIKSLGLRNPFIIDLSIQLNHYNLINRLYLNEKELIDEIWK